MLRFRWLSVFLFLIVASCGDSTGPGGSHVGTYTLVSMNGSSLPYILGVEDGVTVRVLSGRVTLNADGTASSLHRARSSQGTVLVEFDANYTGVYQVDGSAILVDWYNGSPETFSRSGNSITSSTGGIVAVYRK